VKRYAGKYLFINSSFTIQQYTLHVVHLSV